ncbi:MAG: anhydro-N-acetylmuramic acid kinase [Cyclobacteriaceae bacterium]
MEEWHREGKINKTILASIKKIYSKQKPSLGREGFEKEMLSLINNSSVSVQDRLRTVCESIASEIAASIPNKKIKLLATGGGAYNSFLIQLLQQKLP